MRPEPYAWSLEPLFLALAALAAVLYVRAARQASACRPLRIAVVRRPASLLVAGALNSPLETLAAHYLLLVHLLQNVMIADWAPPLLLLGLTPAMVDALAAPRRPAVRVAHPPEGRAAASGSSAGTRSTAPAFYDAALRNPWLLNLEHVALIAIGLLFWWPVICGSPNAALDARLDRLPRGGVRRLGVPRARAHVLDASRSTASTRRPRASGGSRPARTRTSQASS